MLGVSMIRVLANPLTTSIHATGNIKTFQLWEGLVLLLVLPVAYVLLRIFYISPVLTVAVSFICELFAQGVRVLIVLPRIKMNYYIYIKKVLVPIIVVTIIDLLLFLLIKALLWNNTFMNMCWTTSILLIVLLLSIYYIGCNKNEKHLCVKYIKAKIKISEKKE